MIRIGIVGCGRILAAHLRGYQLLREAGVDNFRITALSARHEPDAWSYVKRGVGPQQRQPVGAKAGDPLSASDIYLSDFQEDVEVQVYTDYREMITAGPVDAINDLTTHALHHQVGNVALTSKKHLLTEKPLAITVAAARRMCEQAEAAEVVLGTLENARNRRDTRQLEWLFRAGDFGSLQMILMANVGNWWAPDQIVAETPWRHLRSEGGGITLDIGVHLFNHFRYIGGEVKSIQARAEVLERVRRTRNETGMVTNTVECDADDLVLAAFQTEGGVTGNITASWCGHGQPTTIGNGRGVAYYGTEGSVQDEQVIGDDGHRESLAELYERSCDRKEKERFFPFGLEDAFALNQFDWLEAIRLQREPETNGRDGLRDLATAYAALESSVAGRRVEVDEVLSGSLREYQRPTDEKFGLHE